MTATPELSYVRILPEIILSICGIVVMFVEPLLPQRGSHNSLGVFSFVGTLAALIASLYQTNYPGWGRFNLIRVDEFSVFFHVLICAISAVVILASFEYLETQEIRGGEYYALILFGTVGMVLMSSAVELVLIFIALEISSIATYILAGYRRRTAMGTESSIKYFLLGSFATAFFLYGVAMIFGATGSTSIPEIHTALHGPPYDVLVYVAVALMLIGLAFKVAAAPFHIWTPDVYEGAPAPVVALMSTGPKAAAFAVLLRVLFSTAVPEQGWFWVVWVSAAISMTLGNFGALMQNNVKRMLAYSSIAHAGYLLVAFAAAALQTSSGGRQVALSAAIFYTAAYAVMNIGAFAVVSHLAGSGERFTSIDDYAGLGRRSPLLAFTLTIFMLSLIGIPLTGGFFAKYYVFSAALGANLIWLSIIGLVNSAVAAYYYLRLVVVMYMREQTVETEPVKVTPAMGLALVLAAIATIYLGVAPNSIVEYSKQGAQNLMPAPLQRAGTLGH